MLQRKVPVYYLLLSSILCIVGTWLAICLTDRTPINEEKQTTFSDTDYSIKRLYANDFKYIRPILSVELNRESEKYKSIKNEMLTYLEQQKQYGLTTASVYMRDLSTAKWMGINTDEKYNPGSLLKVGVMMIYFKMAETDTGLLNREVVYHGEKGFVFPIEHFMSDTVVEGRKYKINELIQHMIRFSDNRATVFLENHMDTSGFKKEFNDLGITEPVFNGQSYMLNVKDYTMLLKALYNGAYLRKRASNNALALLTESIFKNGLLKELPSTVEVAHKYGETGDAITHELHEAGIIYLKNKPYLISVMTRGTDWNKLSEVVSHVSRMTYDYMISDD